MHSLKKSHTEGFEPMRFFQRKMPDGTLGNFYVEFDTGARRSLKTKDKVKAKRMFRQIWNGWLKGKVAQMTGVCRKNIGDYRDEFLKWAEVVQPYSSFRANRLALKKLIKQTGERLPLDQISVKHIDFMVKVELEANLSKRSINNYIRHARASLNKAVEWEYIKVNPLSNAKEIKVDRKEPKFLEKLEISKFITSIKDVDLRRIVVAYIVTGRRRSELMWLKWENVNFERKKYSIIAKGDKKQTYSINTMFLAVLLSVGPKKEGRVFDRWKHPDTLSHYVKEALKAAGYPNLTLHSLRHTFASIKAAEGCSLKEIQELLGHSEQRVTEIYTHLTEDHLAEISEVNVGPVDLVGTRNNGQKSDSGL